ncbi:hypothetical protein pb186bvf_011281 [Paramecium bursaria]
MNTLQFSNLEINEIQNINNINTLQFNGFLQTLNIYRRLKRQTQKTKKIIRYILFCQIYDFIEEQLMQFSPDITEKIDNLTKKCLERKKMLQDFIVLMKQRAELEEYYSRNLEIIAESLTKLIHGKDGLKDIFINLSSYLHIQTEQTRGFARQIKNDIIEELEKSLNGDTTWQKDMLQYKTKHQKEIRKNIEQLNSMRDEYIQALKEEKQLQYNPQIVRKYNYVREEQKLNNYIQYFNQYLEQYFQDIASVQMIFQDLELERRKNIQDASLKFLMFEISVIRNLQYDSSGIAGKLEKYNPKQDIQEIFKEQQTDKPLLSKLNFDNFRDFIHQQLSFKPEAAKKKKPIFDSDPRKISIRQDNIKPPELINEQLVNSQKIQQDQGDQRGSNQDLDSEQEQNDQINFLNNDYNIFVFIYINYYYHKKNYQALLQTLSK